MGYVADNARRFFHPSVIDEMLSTFVPLINGTSLDVCPRTVFPSSLDSTFFTEHSVVPILSVDLLTFDTSSVLSSYVVSTVGHKLI
jgi:hypothetical protein